MTNDIQQDINDHKLPADSLIQQLFDLATKLDNINKCIDHARLRVELGNPPGKKGSLGDAVIWETLLPK